LLIGMSIAPQRVELWGENAMIARIKSTPTSQHERDQLDHRLKDLDDLLASVPCSIEASRHMAPLWREWAMLRLLVRSYDLMHRSRVPRRRSGSEAYSEQNTSSTPVGLRAGGATTRWTEKLIGKS
jgi:hypothetical protein